MSDRYSKLRREGLLHGTVKAAREKAKQRFNNKPLKPATTRHQEGMNRKWFMPLPLGEKQIVEANELALEQHPRKKNWNTPQASARRSDLFVFSNGYFKVVEEYEYPYSGRYSKYPSVSYTPTMLSYAAATKSYLYARIKDKTYRITPPKGYSFGQDYLGVYAVKNDHINYKEEDHEYESFFRLHLKTDHILNGKRYLADAVKAHIKRRKAARKAVLLERKVNKRVEVLLNSENFFVTAQDSYNAGNCRAGTVTWGTQHNLREGRYYAASVIKRVTKQHDPRVEKTLRAAAIRTIKENDNGLCRLDGQLPHGVLQ